MSNILAELGFHASTTSNARKVTVLVHGLPDISILIPVAAIGIHFPDADIHE